MILEAKPEAEQLIGFLVGHIRVDLKQLSDCIERTTDDCFILLHEILSSMKNVPGAYSDIEFAKQYIHHIIQL